MPAITYEVTFNITGIGSLSVGEQMDYLEISSGSLDGLDLAQASRLNTQFLISADDQQISFWLGRQIQVQVTPSDTGTATDVFRGFVDSCAVQGIDQSGLNAIVSISASGNMAQVSAINVPASMTSNTERYRINTQIAGPMIEWTWTDFPQAVSWNEISPDQFWYLFDRSDQYEPIFTRSEPIAVAGKTLEAYSGGATDVLSYIQSLARGTGAILWDSPTYSSIIYTPFSAWSTFSATNLDVTTCVLSVGVDSQSDISNIYNSIEWANSTTSVWKTDINSIDFYGQRIVNVNSELANTNDLATMASGRLLGLSQAKPTLSNILIDLDVVDSTLRPFMFYTGMPQFWNLQNVPAIYGGDQIYLQAGTNLSLNYRHAECTMVLSPDSIRRGITQWKQVTAANLWNNYLTAITTWQQVV